MLVQYCTADALKSHERVNAFNLVLPVISLRFLSPLHTFIKWEVFALFLPLLYKIPIFCSCHSNNVGQTPKVVHHLDKSELTTYKTTKSVL